MSDKTMIKRGPPAMAASAHLKATFASARKILAEANPSATKVEVWSLYRMARNGAIFWRCTFENGPREGFWIEGAALAEELE